MVASKPRDLHRVYYHVFGTLVIPSNVFLMHLNAHVKNGSVNRVEGNGVVLDQSVFLGGYNADVMLFFSRGESVEVVVKELQPESFSEHERSTRSLHSSTQKEAACRAACHHRLPIVYTKAITRELVRGGVTHTFKYQLMERLQENAHQMAQCDSPWPVRQFALTLLRALKSLHSHHLSPLDLKLANIGIQGDELRFIDVEDIVTHFVPEASEYDAYCEQYGAPSVESLTMHHNDLIVTFPLAKRVMMESPAIWPLASFYSALVGILIYSGVVHKERGLLQCLHTKLCHNAIDHAPMGGLLRRDHPVFQQCIKVHKGALHACAVSQKVCETLYQLSQSLSVSVDAKTLAYQDLMPSTRESIDVLANRCKVVQGIVSHSLERLVRDLT